MDVRAILSKKGDAVETVRPDTKLVTAARLMRAKGVGALIVSADGSSAQGMLSERDVVVALAERPELVEHARVSEAMTRAFAVAGPTERLQDVMATMTRRRQRHVPVVEGGRLVGVVSVGDIVRHRLEEVGLENAVLRDLAIARS